MTGHKNNRVHGLNDHGFLLYYRHKEEVDMKKAKYYIYHIDEYGHKQYFMGDKKFSCWLNSTCGATSYDFLMDVFDMMEYLTKKENKTMQYRLE